MIQLDILMSPTRSIYYCVNKKKFLQSIIYVSLFQHLYVNFSSTSAALDLISFDSIQSKSNWNGLLHLVFSIFLFSLTMILLLMTAAINRAHSRCAKRHSFDNDMSVMCARVISTLQLSKCASLNCRMKKKETSNANCCHILASDSNFTGFYVISNFEEKKTAIQLPSKFQCDHFFL